MSIERSVNREIQGESRWTSAVGFRDSSFLRFGQEYFGQKRRRVLLIAGAGFDPRAPRLAEQLGAWARDRVTGVFIREERSEPSGALQSFADANTVRLTTAVGESRVETIPVFAIDNAVIGGRNAATLAARMTLEQFTDVVVDLSALSVGTSFPLVGVLLDKVAAASCNLHAVVVADASLDAQIVPRPTEAATAVHGFRGNLGLDESANAARLWLPQLAAGRRELLDRIFRELAPHDICPILPFPSHDPRVGDTLVEEYMREIDDIWDVDPQNIIYAAESDPLDVYRTILNLHDGLAPVFDDDGGSLFVLSPVGSKVLALGALMAAFERGFSVMHVESVGYGATPDVFREYPKDRGTFAHVWLSGDPYISE